MQNIAPDEQNFKIKTYISIIMDKIDDVINIPTTFSLCAKLINLINVMIKDKKAIFLKVS